MLSYELAATHPVNFTDFLHSEIYRTSSKVELSSYKLHVNLDDESFVKHRDTIIDFIDKLGFLGVIVQFKYFNFSAESLLKECDNYQDALRAIDFVKELKANQLENAVKLCAQITHKPTQHYLKGIVHSAKEKTLSQSAVMQMENHFNVDKASSDRFIGQTQFTLYFTPKTDEKKLGDFCVALNNKLHDLHVRPGTLPNTDLKLSPTLSFRQVKLMKSDVQVRGVDDDVKKNDEAIAQLKKEAQSAKLFHTLLKRLEYNVPDILLNAIKQEIKSLDNTIPATAKKKIRLQDALNNAMKNLNLIQTAEDFINFDSDQIGSIKSALNIPTSEKTWSALPQNTLELKKIDSIVSQLMKEKRPEEPCIANLRTPPTPNATIMEWYVFAELNDRHDHPNEAFQGYKTVYDSLKHSHKLTAYDKQLKKYALQKLEALLKDHPELKNTATLTSKNIIK